MYFTFNRPVTKYDQKIAICSLLFTFMIRKYKINGTNF